MTNVKKVHFSSSENREGSNDVQKVGCEKRKREIGRVVAGLRSMRRIGKSGGCVGERNV